MKQFLDFKAVKFIFPVTVVFFLIFLDYREKAFEERLDKKVGIFIDSLYAINPAAIERFVNNLSALKREAEDTSSFFLPKKLYWCGERVPLEFPAVKRRLENEIYNLVKVRQNRWRIELYLNEAQFYFPHFEKTLEQDSLPSDLKYIAVVESEFDNNARSLAGAVGQWQFISATAIRRGLEFSEYVDERRDAEESFRAARDEFRENYKRFGSWFLAAAAYNTGPTKIFDELQAQPGADSSYFNLILFQETMDYGFRFLALKVVMENYRLYGFKEPLYRKQDVAIVSYEVKSTIIISNLAAELGVSTPDFRYLNPRFYAKEIPPGSYEFKVFKKKDVTSKLPHY